MGSKTRAVMDVVIVYAYVMAVGFVLAGVLSGFVQLVSG